MSGVEVRPLSRLPTSRRPTGPTRPDRAVPPYTSRAMQITSTPAPKSTIVLEIELPPERLDRAVNDAVRALVAPDPRPGFRPGKAPRPVLERTLGPARSSTKPSTTWSRPPIARRSSRRTSCR